MKWLTASLLLLSTPLAGQVASTATGAKTYQMTVSDERSCIDTLQLCFSVETEEDGQTSLKIGNLKQDANAIKTLAIPGIGQEEDSGYDRSIVSIWPTLITLPEQKPADIRPSQFLIGILTRQSTMYSGGGASATQLHLFTFRRDNGSPRFGAQLLTLPYGSGKMIRACFSEKDLKNRRGACHDEYQSDASIVLTGQDANGMPVLRYDYKAKNYPSFAKLSEDSTIRGRVKKKELVWADNPDCTYTRILTFNPTSGRYEMDRPGPECSDYDVP